MGSPTNVVFGPGNKGLQVGQNSGTIHYHQGAEKWLEDLYITNPRDDKIRIERTKGGLLKESYDWVFSNDKFREWQKEWQKGARQLLWIRGDPGKGKTMLLCGIIDHLSNCSDPSFNIAYFFCQATDNRINNAPAVLRGLIWMLADQHRELVSHIIQKRYKNAGQKLFEGPNAWIALSEILDSILEHLDREGLRKTYLIIDALDECTNQAGELHRLVVEESPKYKSVKWIISSRNWPEIEEDLQDASDKITLRLELHPESVSEAVDNYIQVKVKQLRGYPNDFTQKLREHLSANANGTFLWVALVCQQFATARQLDKKKLLKELAESGLAKLFPRGLDELYQRMMSRIHESEESVLCKEILAIASCVHRPITLAELKSMSGAVQDLEPDDEDLEYIIGLCGSFLTLQDRTIFFVHQSAKDFLLNPKMARDEVFPSGLEDVHQFIFSKSLEALQVTLKRDMYNLRAPGFPIERVKAPDNDPLTPVRYFCEYWVDHLLDAKERANSELQDAGKVEAFFREKSLYWFEALSLVGELARGIASLVRFDSFLQQQSSGSASRLATIVHDARRFIQYNRGVIESYPLQAYASALVFSPTSSLIRTFFEEQEAPKWIITKPFIQDGWDACVSTLELPDISWGAQVAWSPSGAQLAFSQNNTIYLLDPTTCQYIRTLKGHKGKIICIAWASNSLQLASASKDRTVKIWDPVTGQCTATLDQVNADVIAWIPNTARLASGGADGEVGIWDSTTSTCLQTFQGHEDRVWSLAVSPNGNWLAAGFRTKIEIWDLANKIHHATFEHEDGQVNGIESISWSPCSTRFASGRGISCGVWDLGTRTCVKEFGFGAKVVTWSPNETRPALAATQGRIKILDPTTLEETATLKSHDIIQNISWSPNGSLLASITMKTLQIWDATVGRNAPKLKIDAHTSWVHTMAVSANGAHLATASHDTTIMVWELATGKCISKLTHHFGHPYILAWSPANHNQLASATWDPCEVKIWDVMTHQCIATRSFPAHRLQDLAWSQDGGKLALSLKCYGLITERRVDIWDPTATESDGVETLPLTVDTYDGSFSVNWSPDGTLLAVAGNKFICLWDLATKQCIRMFDHHRADIFRLSWSPNGDILASRAQRSVDVWDPTTGQRVFTIDDIDNFCSFRFDTLNPHLLHTNVGTFELYPGSSESPSSGPPKPPFRHVGYGINKEKTWITYQGENVLWLPSEYRPFVSELVDSHTIALGYENGWVHFLGFSPTNPPV